ncbi:MAG: imidazole glycerol phosphate synthase subunit HisH [Elusimicrobia bacterium]|nr:imidazole glycerol phosphate synthase subunit HisH [Elusimicrobiota bacterium]
MNPSVRTALINYDMGNLRSVSKSLEKAGCQVDLVSEPFDFNSYQLAVLPGVGAFAQAAQNLKKRKLFSLIQDWIAQDRPFLGICLGYQLLFEESEESKKRKVPGLGIFKGKVKKFPVQGNLKVPHMGWNQIHYKASDTGSQSIFGKIGNDSYFYFVHSYFPAPKEKSLVMTTTTYGIPFASSIRRGRLFASQFHPEKSGENGLNLLRNFISNIF